MPDEARAATTTILFTDLVSSTELLQRAGDEDAQSIFQAHHRLLGDAARANGGHEVKWLGDGLMVAFPSAADAVRCAIAMQQASRRPAAGERLEIRVGLNAGDALRSESDYFGTPVVVAKRLCDRAEAGQILCSAVVAGLLAGRQAFAFRELGALDLKGIAQAVSACDVSYERDDPVSMLAHTPFVGRAGESARLRQKLTDARGGRGGLVMLVGEPGIGKTRLAEEFADAARNDGARVLRGHCFEGEWTPPYAPFAEAIDGYARDADADELRDDLGHGAAPIARLAPAIRQRLPDVPDAAPLQPDEERFRLLDAIAQLLIASSKRAPVLLVLDDLHWADRGTIAMLRHVARSARQHALVIVGTYRDVELDRQHPLADALAALRREAEYDRILMKGLERDEVATLLETLAEHDVNPALVQAISDETDGNPFFIREVLIHLVQERKIFQQDGRWTSNLTIAEIGIPEGVRQVITRRLSRLSGDANKLMSAASAFNGGFRFQTIAAVAGLDETAALDAIDEALEAQLLRATEAEHYDFTHALIRHTLYGEMNPSRQVRLHRTIAEVMGARVATYTPERQAAHAGELAYQYHRSAAIPGAERGVDYAIAAAGGAEASAAWDEAAAFLRMALDLMPEGEARRPRLLGRLAIALFWALRPDEGERVAREAADAIAAAEGDDAAAGYLYEAGLAANESGASLASWSLGAEGLRRIGPRRDRAWQFFRWAGWQDATARDPDAPGVMFDVQAPGFEEWVEAARHVLEESGEEFPGGGLPPARSRSEALRWADTHPELRDQGLFWIIMIGDNKRALAEFRRQLAEAVQQGRLASQVLQQAMISRCHTGLGELQEARAAYDRGVALAARLPGQQVQSVQGQQILAAIDELRIATGEEISESLGLVNLIISQDPPEIRWARAVVFAASARVFARAGQRERALELLARTLPALERAGAWEGNLTRIICDCASTLWTLDCTDHVEVIERNLREKIVEPDRRFTMFDGRTALARLCALTGRYDEASHWFAEARTILDEDGARTCRAIVDYDEALMFIRRGAGGDTERARPLLEAAMAQFREIGMTGWLREAEALRGQT